MHVAAVGKAFIERFKLMCQIANRSNFSHARAALERVQIA